MSKLGFIGTGHIAAPMVRFLSDKGHDIAVTKRSKAVSHALADSHGVKVLDTQAVLDFAETVFLCVRPHQVDTALAGLTWSAGHRIISVMADVPRATLETACAPAVNFVQTIPLGYLEQGGCPLAAYGESGLLAALFEPENPVIDVPSEDALNAHFAICALVPGLLDLMATGAGWLAGQTGDAQSAEHYTKQLVAGFLATMDQNLAAERDALATAGTLSLQMTTALQDGGTHETLSRALTAIGQRLRA